MFPDEWVLSLFSKYILMHFSAGAVIVSACLLLGLSVMQSVAVIVIIALLKDGVYDKFIKKTCFGIKDVLATIAGGLAVVAPYFSLL